MDLIGLEGTMTGRISVCPKFTRNGGRLSALTTVLTLLVLCRTFCLLSLVCQQGIDFRSTLKLKSSLLFYLLTLPMGHYALVLAYVGPYLFHSISSHFSALSFCQHSEDWFTSFVLRLLFPLERKRLMNFFKDLCASWVSVLCVCCLDLSHKGEVKS